MKGQSHTHTVQIQYLCLGTLIHSGEVKRLTKGPCDFLDWACSTLIESTMTFLHLTYSPTETGKMSLKRQRVIEAEISHTQEKFE